MQMKNNMRRNVAIGAAAVVALGGGGIAVAAGTASKSSATDRQKAFIEDAAKRLSVTPEALTSALKGAFGDQLDQAVKDGKLTQKQADALKQRIEKGGLPLGGGPGFGGPGGRGGHGPGGMDGPGDHGAFGAGLDAAATYLGLTEQELRAKLVKGTSLADVAKAQSKDVGGLEQAIVDATKKKLDQAVTDGKLTATQRDDIEKDLAARVKDIVENAGPPKAGARSAPRGGGFGPPSGTHRFRQHP